MKKIILLTGHLRLVAKTSTHVDVLGMLFWPIGPVGGGHSCFVDISNQVQTFYLGYSDYGYPSICLKMWPFGSNLVLSTILLQVHTLMVRLKIFPLSVWPSAKNSKLDPVTFEKLSMISFDTFDFSLVLFKLTGH